MRDKERGERGRGEKERRERERRERERREGEEREREKERGCLSCYRWRTRACSLTVPSPSILIIP